MLCFFLVDVDVMEVVIVCGVCAVLCCANGSYEDLVRDNHSLSGVYSYWVWEMHV